MKLGTKIGLMGLSILALTTGAFSRIVNGVPKEATETIRLHHIKPSDFLRAVATVGGEKATSNFQTLHPMRGTQRTMLPDDIRQIDTDDTTGKMVIRGGSEGVSRLHAIASALDVSVPSVKFDVNILHSSLKTEYFLNGKHSLAPREGEIVGTGSVRAVNDEDVDVAIIADQHLFLAHLKPHILGNGQISVSLQLTTESVGAVEHEIGKAPHRYTERSSVTDTLLLGRNDNGSAANFILSGSDSHLILPESTPSSDGTYFVELVPHLSH